MCHFEFFASKTLENQGFSQGHKLGAVPREIEKSVVFGYNLEMPRRKLTILLVEDEKLIKEIYAQRIEKEGIRVISVSSTKEAEETLQARKIDLLVLDLLLPQENGLVFLKRLRKKKKYTNLPVIILTNLEDGVSLKEAQNLKAKAYFLKTDFTPAELAQKVKQILCPNE